VRRCGARNETLDVPQGKLLRGRPGGVFLGHAEGIVGLPPVLSNLGRGQGSHPGIR
jgi:hypothetical protein